MKTKLKSLLTSIVPHSFFVTTCLLLLATGAACWTTINSIGAEADAGMMVLGLPEPLAVSLARHAVPEVTNHSAYAVSPSDHSAPGMAN